MALTLCSTVTACTDATGRKYLDECEDAGRARVFQRIPPVRSFFDATGDGCSTTCLGPLMMNEVDYVEIEFDQNTYEKMIEKGDIHKTAGAVPPANGLFKVTLAKRDDCKFEGYRPVFEARSCIQFEKISALQARYSYKTTKKTVNFQYGHATVWRYDLSDRKTGKLVAFKQPYDITWALAFFFPAYRACGLGSKLELSEVIESAQAPDPRPLLGQP